MNRLQVSDLGPIKEADITFGDLTLLVGPQASGKSILLQLFKLLGDEQQVRLKVERYGYVWGETDADILNRYFGEGMSGIWNNRTAVTYNGKSIFADDFLKGETLRFSNPNWVFYIPAQRIICLQNGWPKYFNDYDDSVPFVLRDFSETIRLFAETNIKTSNFTYSSQQGLNNIIRQSFDNSIYHDAEITLDTEGRKRFRLNINSSSIPFMAWSAGQKEFMPLLMSFYYLCPKSAGETKDLVQSVVIEEPEMGLHPQAIQSVMLQILDLMHRGYQVMVSTHSPVLLELLWTIKYLQSSNGTTADLFELFSLQPDESVEAIFQNIIQNKTFATYFFDKTKEGVIVKNISTLDAGSEDPAVASWGGLTDFAARSGDVVSKLVANEE